MLILLVFLNFSNFYNIRKRNKILKFSIEHTDIKKLWITTMKYHFIPLSVIKKTESNKDWQNIEKLGPSDMLVGI